MPSTFTPSSASLSWPGAFGHSLGGWTSRGFAADEESVENAVMVTAGGHNRSMINSHIRCVWCNAEAVVEGSVCPMSLSCPTCGAGPSKHCRRPSGHVDDVLHRERWRAAEVLDAEAGIVYEATASELIVGYADQLDVDGEVGQLLKDLPPYGAKWAGTRFLDAGLGTVLICRVRPGRVLHVIGFGPVAERLRAAISAGRVPGWTLHPRRDGATPVERLCEPLRAVCGSSRLYTPLERWAFATVEEVEATPNESLAEITNIGWRSIPLIRQAIAQVLS